MLPESCPLKENLVPSLKGTESCPLTSADVPCHLSPVPCPPRPPPRCPGIIAQWKEMPEYCLAAKSYRPPEDPGLFSPRAGLAKAINKPMGLQALSLPPLKRVGGGTTAAMSQPPALGGQKGLQMHRGAPHGVKWDTP